MPCDLLDMFVDRSSILKIFLIITPTRSAETPKSLGVRHIFAQFRKVTEYAFCEYVDTP